MDNNSKRRKQRITALTLVLTLLMGGCSSEKKNDRFELTENENNEIVAIDDSYIDKDYIGNYYVVEVYNRLKKENEIYIASKKVASTRGYYYCGYLDIFTNIEIVDVSDEDEETIFSFVKATSLNDYIVSLGLGQLKYSYDDMKNIYEVIKENYVFEKDGTLRRKLMNGNIM